MSLHELVAIDALKRINLGSDLFAYIHNDHRFCLLLLFSHQQRGDLPKPTNLILFDQHHDLAPPNSAVLETLKSMRHDGFSFDELLSVCRDRLREDDSDWIKAGMELGIIDHLVSFEVRDDGGRSDEPTFTDHTEYDHITKILCCSPGQHLNHQGELSDISRRAELVPLWEILGCVDISS